MVPIEHPAGAAQGPRAVSLGGCGAGVDLSLPPSPWESLVTPDGCPGAAKVPVPSSQPWTWGAQRCLWLGQNHAVTSAAFTTPELSSA